MTDGEHSPADEAAAKRAIEATEAATAAIRARPKSYFPARLANGDPSAGTTETAMTTSGKSPTTPAVNNPDDERRPE